MHTTHHGFADLCAATFSLRAYISIHGASDRRLADQLVSVWKDVKMNRVEPRMPTDDEVLKAMAVARKMRAEAMRDCVRLLRRKIAQGAAAIMSALRAGRAASARRQATQPPVGGRAPCVGDGFPLPP